jgi:hypothetical protein
LRCERDADGNCLRVDFCDPLSEDERLAEAEERAWSSPIFVDFGI